MHSDYRNGNGKNKFIEKMIPMKKRKENRIKKGKMLKLAYANVHGLIQ